MTTAKNPNNNLSPWKPGQSAKSSGRPRGARDLADYVFDSSGRSGNVYMIGAYITQE